MHMKHTHTNRYIILYRKKRSPKVLKASLASHPPVRRMPWGHHLTYVSHT